MKSNHALGGPAMAALWFGAAVSMAEMLTGSLLADLGWSSGLAVILAGHLFGAAIFFGAGWVSWKRRQTAIAVTRQAFGRAGLGLFGTLNVIQLLGWTVVMVIVGGQGLDRLAQGLGMMPAEWLWKLAIGGLLVLWAGLGLGKARWLNQAAVWALAGLTLYLAWALWGTGQQALAGQAGSQAAAGAASPGFGSAGFGAALELVIIMPLSWLPLVGDYTRTAVSGWRSCLVAALAYAVGSSWMYLIGLGTSLATGQGDPTMILHGPLPTLIGIGIVLLSTVTTAFLDVHSAAVSARTMAPRLSASLTGPVLAGLGTVIALLVPLDQYQNFLYLIGSAFAPLYAVILANHFLIRQSEPAAGTAGTGWLPAFAAWAAGVGLYYLLLPGGTPLGVTLPVMAAVALLYLGLVHLARFLPARTAAPRGVAAPDPGSRA